MLLCTVLEGWRKERQGSGRGNQAESPFNPADVTVPQSARGHVAGIVDCGARPGPVVPQPMLPAAVPGSVTLGKVLVLSLPQFFSHKM